ncbi:hypothetical protein Forpi1262_v014554 [Fusarium oxysporum f. sp. raphani]|uniref:C2H2-type domain-containing protein n=1 Tax=Fusarium oxysporum f. sp. raphani TaxID=96318 RepID=A0A8J5U123_FUSOX|nr:hypothetical protein Forpi1262_v014554 [Fusarium oxysporum f. sp. raphani]
MLATFRCQVCPEVFATFDELKSHDKRFQSQTQSVIEELTQCSKHISQIPEDAGSLSHSFMCQTCSRGFISHDDLIAHVQKFRMRQSQLVSDLVYIQAHVVWPKNKYSRTDRTECPLAVCAVKHEDASNRRRHYQNHMSLIEACSGCHKTCTTYQQVKKHKCCNESPLMKVLITNRQNCLNTWAAEQYSLACERSLENEQSIPQPSTTQHSISQPLEQPPLDINSARNASLSGMDAHSASVDAVNDLLQTHSQVATHIHTMGDPKTNFIAGHSFCMDNNGGKILQDAQNLGLFCMDNDAGKTLQDAQNLGLFCLDNTADHVECFLNTNMRYWDNVGWDSQPPYPTYQGSHNRTEGTDRRKRPQEFISS